MGGYNVGVGVLRRGPTKPGAPVAPSCTRRSPEVYYVCLRLGHAADRRHRVERGPPPATARSSEWPWAERAGHVQGAGAAAQGERGDIVIIPPGVYHGFDEVTDHVEYVAVRPDPEHVLPAAGSIPR
jgi:hypothetical protein